jgi:hypothetical protein
MTCARGALASSLPQLHYDSSFARKKRSSGSDSTSACLDYTETTFSPVIRMASLRLFLFIAAVMDVELCQLDIGTAFVFAPIKEDTYIP